jgi:hypothetical protein
VLAVGTHTISIWVASTGAAVTVGEIRTTTSDPGSS